MRREDFLEDLADMQKLENEVKTRKKIIAIRTKQQVASAVIDDVATPLIKDMTPEEMGKAGANIATSIARAILYAKTGGAVLAYEIASRAAEQLGMKMDRIYGNADMAHEVGQSVGPNISSLLARKLQSNSPEAQREDRDRQTPSAPRVVRRM